MSFFFVQPQAKVHARVALIQSTYAWLSTHKHKFKIAKKKILCSEMKLSETCPIYFQTWLPREGVERKGRGTEKGEGRSVYVTDKPSC